jgi:hypothetical protein
MNHPHHVLPQAAAAALLEMTGAPSAEAGPSRAGGLKIDQGWQTVILEPEKGGWLLRLSRDCPFDEIAPAYLTVFVRNLSELCPGVDIAYRNQCGHPIVASLPLTLSSQATIAEWKAGMETAMDLLEGALTRQEQAAESLRFDRREHRYATPWPVVAVNPEQLRGLARFAGLFEAALGEPRKDLQAKLPEILELGGQLEAYLRASGLLQPEREWVGVLLRPELEMGFWDHIDCRHFDASQLVVVLNAIIQGGRYNEILPRRAYAGRMIPSILTRAKELAG